eukprot:607425-Rhodomonas_salina.1
MSYNGTVHGTSRFLPKFTRVPEYRYPGTQGMGLLPPGCPPTPGNANDKAKIAPPRFLAAPA